MPAPACSGSSTRSTPRRKRRTASIRRATRSPLHHELTWALGGARDATAEVAEALDEQGLDGVAPLLHEWRGALFRVRLARLRLAAPKPAPEPPALQEPQASELARPLVAVLLALVGALAFAVGAVLALWPVWVAGIVAVTASVLWYRP